MRPLLFRRRAARRVEAAAGRNEAPRADYILVRGLTPPLIDSPSNWRRDKIVQLVGVKKCGMTDMGRGGERGEEISWPTTEARETEI